MHVCLKSRMNIKQTRVDCINPWRALCLEYKDRISETSAIEMCIDEINWELLYSLKGIKNRNFEELATRAHDMEIIVKGHRKSHTTSSKVVVKQYKKTKQYKNNQK